MEKEVQRDLPGLSVKENWQQLADHYADYIRSLSERRKEYVKITDHITFHDFTHD